MLPPLKVGYDLQLADNAAQCEEHESAQERKAAKDATAGACLKLARDTHMQLLTP